MAAWAKLFLLAFLFVTTGRTADVDPAVLYQQVRANVLDNNHKMLHYSCVETIDRAQYFPGKQAESCNRPWPQHGPLAVRDRLRLDVTLMNANEIFSWVAARQFESHDLDKIVGAGATGTGEFAGFLLSVFDRQPDQL